MGALVPIQMSPRESSNVSVTSSDVQPVIGCVSGLDGRASVRATSADCAMKRYSPRSVENHVSPWRPAKPTRMMTGLSNTGLHIDEAMPVEPVKPALSNDAQVAGASSRGCAANSSSREAVGLVIPSEAMTHELDSTGSTFHGRHPEIALTVLGE